MAPTYRLAESEGQVEAWSVIRLPYEPKGDILHFRNELRATLGRMRSPCDHEMLLGTYMSAVSSLCDLENVLTYNVGLGSFARLAPRRLRLLRAYATPSACNEDGEAFAHHMSYVLQPESEFPAGPRIGEWDFTIPSGVPIKPETVWHYAKRGTLAPHVGDAVEGRFGMVLEIASPIIVQSSLIYLVKPLLDGLIVAFHAHDGSRQHEILPTLVQRLRNVDAAQVVDDLLDERHAVLGRRRLVHPFGQGVQWNPADDLCDQIDIRRTPSIEDVWRCRGFLSKIVSSL